MLRLLSVLLCVVGLVVSGCGGEDGAAPEPRAPATVTVTASPTVSPSASTTPQASPTARPVPSPQQPAAPSDQGPPPTDLSSHDLPGFTTPSGNIGCLFDHYRRPHVRCDRLEMDHVPAGKPADCEFDWGHSVEVSRGRPAALACTSDTVMGLQGETDGSRVLPYGDSVRYRGITCTSEQTGLRCSTAGGHGFVLSRAGIRVS